MRVSTTLVPVLALVSAVAAHPSSVPAPTAVESQSLGKRYLLFVSPPTFASIIASPY